MRDKKLLPCNVHNRKLLSCKLDNRTIPFLYTSAIFSPPEPTQHSPLKLFPPTSVVQPISDVSRVQWARESHEDWHCFNHSLFPKSIGRSNSTHNHRLLISQIHKIDWRRYFLSEYQTMASITLPHTLNLLSLLPYPTNTIKRPHMPLVTNFLTTIFIPNLAFTYTIHAPLLPHVRSTLLLLT